MASQLLPTPVAAVIGIVPAVVAGVRALPGRAVQLPVLAVSNALATMDMVRREYDGLAERGERLVHRLRGGASDLAEQVADRADEVEDRVEDLVARTPFATAYDRVEDALEDVVETAASTAQQAATTAADTATATVEAAATTIDSAVGAVGTVAGAVETVVDTAVDTAVETATEVAGSAAEQLSDVAPADPERVVSAAQQAVEAAERALAEAAARVEAAASDVEQAPKGAPTPKAVQPDATRVDTAAPSAVVRTVEQVARTVGAPVLEHDELPLQDYDHMTLGSLRGRLRSLSLDELVAVRSYEKVHADRLPVVTMLDNRIAKLASEGTQAG